PATLNMDVSRLEAAITPRTRAIMPVHYAGLPVDLDPMYALAKKHGLRVVEDCAHAIGAEYKGKKLGSFGDIQVMSFHPNKNMTTGEGGCVITDDQEVISAIERLRFHGIDRNAFNRFAKSGSQQYDVVVPGYKYNMMDMQAALGIHQLPELDGFIETRTTLVRRYYDKLAHWPELTLPQPPAYAHKHAWHLFTPRLQTNKSGLDRDGFINAMKAENIGIGLHYQSTHIFSWYKERYGWQPADFPHALAAGNAICSLPLFPTLTEAEQDRVIEAMCRVLRA
ncbi:MAG: DegT/DnrJ/EryC1/StrS family aminotransferase, partial [Pseudomonadota bacterium]|nr:DegT/DnrJ/EryC1/StrS family aminotransferase [Pseudomonadota bacterium]